MKALSPPPEHRPKPPNTVRALLTSDWHGDKSTAGLPRFDDVMSSARRAAELAVALRVDWYVFLGDLTDPEPGAHRVVAAAIEVFTFLLARRIGVVVLGGNHDACEDSAASSAIDPIAAHARVVGGDFVVFTQPGHIELGPGVFLVALPHPHRGKPYDPEKWLDEQSQLREIPWGMGERSVLVAGHLEVDAYEQESHRGSEATVMPRGRPGRFPVAKARALWGDRAVLVNGHYHKAHMDPVLVPGALERLARDEMGHEPQVLVVDLPGGAS